MTTDDVVLDVSQDWVLACDVQRRFMHGRVGPAIRWTAARAAAMFEPSAAIAMILRLRVLGSAASDPAWPICWWKIISVRQPSRLEC